MVQFYNIFKFESIVNLYGFFKKVFDLEFKGRGI